MSDEERFGEEWQKRHDAEREKWLVRDADGKPIRLAWPGMFSAEAQKDRRA